MLLLQLVRIPFTTIHTTLLYVEQEVQDFVLPMVSHQKDIRLHVLPSSSQLVHILLLHKVVLMLLLVTCTRMTGGGTFMIPSKEVIGWETRMLSST